MAFSISSCIKPSSPPAPSSSSLAKPTMAPWSTSKEARWQSRCISTAACLIITSTVSFSGVDTEAAMAANEPTFVERAAEKATVRWSDKRKCPPWHVNNLENIVPENLPRPLGSRRPDGYAAYRTGDAPVIAGGIGRRSGGCYSL